MENVSLPTLKSLQTKTYLEDLKNVKHYSL